MVDLDHGKGDDENQEEEAMFSTHKMLLLTSIDHLANMDIEKVITLLK